MDLHSIMGVGKTKLAKSRLLGTILISITKSAKVEDLISHKTRQSRFVPRRGYVSFCSIGNHNSLTLELQPLKKK